MGDRLPDPDRPGVLLFRLVQRGQIFPASVSAVGTLLVPIVGVASGVAVLGEPFGLRDLIALALIVGAVALVLLVPAGDPVAGRRAPGPR